MAEVSMKTRQELINRHKERYRKATKKEKGKILDSICLDTGMSRDRAARLLSGKAKTKKRLKPEKRGRKPVYGEDVQCALRTVWVYMDFACGKRLAEGMGDMLTALVRYGEVGFDEDIQKKLRKMSPATADRLLVRERSRLRFKGISTTKPGTLLKKDIPIRTGTEWSDAIPGYVEVDLVAHCGMSTAGEYINTLDVTDISSGWTETIGVVNKAERHVFAALKEVEKRQPFPVLGIDSDNGSEFINHELYRYCKANNIVFTRSRPYTKNDNCHVEQKNWSVVRRNIGYGRYEGADALSLLNQYYGLLRLYTNYFLPQTKLISKHRNGAKIQKKYEKPLSPYKRLLASEHIEDSAKQALRETFISLNPAGMKRDMILVLEKLEKLAVPQ